MCDLHVCLACLALLVHVAAPDRGGRLPQKPRRHHATGWVLRRYGAGVWVHQCGDTDSLRLACALDAIFTCHPTIMRSSLRSSNSTDYLFLREGGPFRLSPCHICIGCHGEAASPMEGCAVYVPIPEVFLYLSVELAAIGKA